MGKALIVSDSHGLTAELTELKRRHGQEVQLQVHCGDSELTANDQAIEDFLVVKGNCDYEKSFDQDIVKKFGDLTFLITHGHRYSVKHSLMALLYRAREVSAQVVCFGHTHVLGAEMVKNTLFVNPGSLSLPRGRSERTYVILDIQDSKIEVRVYDYDKGELKDLEQIFPLPKKHEWP